MTENRTQNQSGGTATSAPVNQQWQREFDTNTSSPTSYLEQFDRIVGRARQIGVTEQQLLDSISQHYSGSGSGTTK